MYPAPASSLLAGYYVISLRPAGAHGGLRRAAARLGARTFALPPWRLVFHDDAAVRATLREALAAEIVLFTSPPAVRAACALQTLVPARYPQRWLAVGTATARALRAAGIVDVQSPARMDSEGLLALPALANVRGMRIGLVTAPGGRGVLAPALTAAGARVIRADVYARQPVSPAPGRIAALMALPAPWLLPLSSGEALDTILGQLPPAAVDRLRDARVVAASARLAEQARVHGFRDIRIARDARPGSLLAAADAGHSAS